MMAKALLVLSSVLALTARAALLGRSAALHSHRQPSPRLCSKPIPDADGIDTGGFEAVLRDPDTDLTIECTILETTTVGPSLYASMVPRDVPAVIACFREGEMVEIDDDETLALIFPTAEAVCQENGVEILNTAVSFTLVGELETIDELVNENGDSQEVMQLEDTSEDDEDGAEVVVTFFHEGEKYYVMRLVAPVVLVGRQLGAASFEVPSEAEMGQVGPLLERIMEQSMDDMFGEDEEDGEEFGP